MPCPEIFIYDGEEIQGNNLWCVRCVLDDDKNSFKLIGIFAEDANNKAKELRIKYGNSATIFYYEYFTALISGTFFARNDEFCAEIVKGNLWESNEIELLITYNKDKISALGNPNIITTTQMRDLLSCTHYIQPIIKEQNLLLEWSISNTDNIIFYNIKEDGVSLLRAK